MTRSSREGGGLQHAGVRYELLRRLGSSPHGQVFAARAVGPGFERMVCIKRLPPLTGTAEPVGASGIREEARLLARVRHANVVSLLALGEDAEGAPFLVLELVEGVDLRALGRLPDRLAVHVACAVLRALAAAQRTSPGLVHRDVTPHNVLVSVHGEVKLGDFGIALARDRARWTPPLLVKGKLGYLSPEQILAADIDPRSDLFAVGVVLYEQLAGAPPWGLARTVRDLRAVVDAPAPPLHGRRPDVDRALSAAVDRLIERDPARRFATAEDALRAIGSFGAGELGSLRLAKLVRDAAAPSMP